MDKDKYWHDGGNANIHPDNESIVIKLERQHIKFCLRVNLCDLLFSAVSVFFTAENKRK